MWDLLKEININSVAIFALACSIMIGIKMLGDLSKTLHEHIKEGLKNVERLRLAEQRLLDAEQAIMLAHKFMSTIKQKSMDMAIQDATLNPEKYMTGEFAFSTMPFEVLKNE